MPLQLRVFSVLPKHCNISCTVQDVLEDSSLMSKMWTVIASCNIITPTPNNNGNNNNNNNNTPWSTVLLEKLTGLQLVKKFPAFYGTGRFITAFTSARHLSLS